MYNLTYKIKENGYEIYKDNTLWISQYEPYIPNPSLSYEENAIKHIEELNTSSIPNIDIENKISILTEENKKQDELIDISLMATDEMYMMLEPLLANSISLNNKYSSKMVSMYVAMVERGLKTIDEVPLRYREEVRAAI